MAAETKLVEKTLNPVDTLRKLSSEGAGIAKAFLQQRLSIQDFRKISDDFLDRFNRFHKGLIEEEKGPNNSRDIRLLIDVCEGCQYEFAHFLSYGINPPLRSPKKVCPVAIEG